jgi:hypothetical protein
MHAKPYSKFCPSCRTVQIRTRHLELINQFSLSISDGHDHPQLVGLFLGTVMVIGTFRSDGSSEMTAGSRTGRIARSMPDGKLCHYIVFDYRTATAVEDRVGRCDEDKPKPKKERPAAFSWGK